MDTYLRGVDWEPQPALSARTSSLLPALTLARVAGASPVEYLTDQQRDAVTVIGRRLLATPLTTLSGILRSWADSAA